MNIFVVNDDPFLAAKDLPDKLLVKMVLESTQIAATAMSEGKLNLGFLTKKDGSPYRPTHINHPSVRWASENINNLCWVVDHGLGLAAEYTNRYEKIHSCQIPLLTAKSLLNQLGARSDLHSDFTMAMPEAYKSDNPVTSYRKYLHTKGYAKWDRIPESTPEWWDPELHKLLS